MAEVIAGARVYIPAPPVTPLGGGVLSVARVVESQGDHALMGAQFLSDACADLSEWTEWCTNDPVAAKLFDDEPDLVIGDPFVVYAGLSCDLQNANEARTRVRTRFDLAEGRGVDRNVVAMMEDQAVDLGGPFPVNQAMGVAEGYTAAVYGGVPTLLVPRQFIPCACGNGALKNNLDGSLQTCQGSKVANVTTAMAATPPAPGPVPDTSTIYVTGQITLLRSDVNVFSVPQQLLADGAFAPARALAERVYVPLFECLVAKVEASCS
jgi:hypothetical protein